MAQAAPARIRAVATCPDCGAFLSENHHCTVRRRARRVGKSVWAALVGAVLCTLVLYAVNDNPPWVMVTFVVVAGVILGPTVRKAWH